MFEKLNPPDIMQPFNNAYHHVVVLPPNARIAYVAGQVGLDPSGELPPTLEAQAEQAWTNLLAALRVARMGAENIVKITVYLVDAADYPVFAAARAQALGDTRPASTALLVKQLLKPEWRFEVEAVAAAPQ
ncbi:MAG: RidA family protein [Gammaproteobacteria bacterium]